MIVGFSGFARSGKDTAVEYLVREHGFTRIAFADKLRDFLYALNPVVCANYEHHGLVPTSGYLGPVYSTVQEEIDKSGWDGYKSGPFSDDIRRLLQRLGTEAGRQTLWDTIWIDAALNGLDSHGKYAVSDARFFNEFDAIRDAGGQVWRIERPGIGPANDHASEMEAIDYPHFEGVLYNDSTIEEFELKVRSILV